MKEDKTGLIGRCGLFCEACIIYGVSHRPEDVFQGWREKTAERLKCRAEQVACEGCQQLTENCWGIDCDVRKCLDARGYVYCDECPDINGCEKFGELDEHYGGLTENMTRLRNLGPGPWLAEKRRERTCPVCGGVLYYSDQAVCPVCYGRT